jgi:hypothetical protein
MDCLAMRVPLSLPITEQNVRTSHPGGLASDTDNSQAFCLKITLTLTQDYLAILLGLSAGLRDEILFPLYIYGPLPSKSSLQIGRMIVDAMV